MKSFGSNTPGNTSSSACYKCGQEGHFSNGGVAALLNLDYRATANGST